MTADEFAKLEARLQPVMARGERARSLLGSGCWKSDVEPYLMVRCADLQRGSGWKPSTGVFSVDAVAMGAAYNGGREDECLNLRNVLNIWVEQGRLAGEELKKEQEKIKR